MNNALTEEMGDVAVNENPYLAGLTKKTRSLKKKMEKIKKTEDLKEAGKRLNAEQIKLLETRPFVEVALVEHARIRSAMETVALDFKSKELEEAKLASSASAATPTLSPASIQALKGDDNDGNSTPSTDVDAPSINPSEESSTESIGVATDPILIEHASAQTELSGPPPPPGLDPAKASIAIAKAAMYAAKEKEEAEARGLVAGRAEVNTGLTKILGLLHATTWCYVKGKSLPTAIDFFSKVLLGKTVPPEVDFDDCLEQSVERAIMYLNPSNSSKEVAPGITFEKLDQMVSSLREDIIVDLAPKEPTFNFFPDLCPEESVKKESVASFGEPEGAAPSLDRNINSQPSEPAAISEEESPANQALPPMAPKPLHNGQHPMANLPAEPLCSNRNINSQPSEPVAMADEESPANQAPPPVVPKPPQCGQHSMAPPPAEPLPSNRNINSQPPELAAISEEESPANQVRPAMTPKPPHNGQLQMAPPLAEPLSPNGNIILQPSQPAASKEESQANQEPPPMASKPPHIGQRRMAPPLAEPLPPRPLVMVVDGDPSSLSRAIGHADIQDEDVELQALRFRGRQPSQMEKGMLPPVVKQDQPRPPPAVIKEDAALPKHEERQKDRRNAPPPPPICQGPLGAGAKFISQTRNPLQPVFCQQQVWSSLAGPTSAGYAGGWGYPRISQEAQHVQRNSFRLPLNLGLTHMHPELDGKTKKNGAIFPNTPSDVPTTTRDANGPPPTASGDMQERPTNSSKPSPDEAQTSPDPRPAVVAKLGPTPTPAGPGCSDQLSTTPGTPRTPMNGDVCTSIAELPENSGVSASEETTGKPRGGRSVKGGGSNPCSRRAKRVEAKSTANKHGDDIPRNKPTANGVSNSSPQSSPVVIASPQEGPAEQGHKKGEAEKNGKIRRSKERGRGKPVQRQGQEPRAQQQQLQGPCVRQETDRSASGSAKRGVPTRLTSSPTRTAPSKSPPQGPTSLSWADEVPSPTTQPVQQQQQQRGSGRGRNRRAWHRKPQGYSHEVHHAGAHFYEAEIMQHGRNATSRGQGRANVANGGKTGGRVRDPFHVGTNGLNGAVFTRNHGRSEQGVPKAEAHAQASAGWNNGYHSGSFQGSGYRKSGIP